MYRERGHLALNSSLNPWPVPVDTRPSAPWKGLECVRDSDCDMCFQLPGAVPEGRPGAWSGECPGVCAHACKERKCCFRSKGYFSFGKKINVQISLTAVLLTMKY